MASANKLSSGRKLKTYGKSSTSTSSSPSLVYGHLRRASNPSRHRLSAPTEAERIQTEKKDGTCRDGGDQLKSSSSLTTTTTNTYVQPRAADAAATPQPPPTPPPARKHSNSVFDIASSSSDDGQTIRSPEPWRKRRKLGAPVTPLRSNSSSHLHTAERRRLEQRHVTPLRRSSPPHSKTKGSTTLAASPDKLPKLEVVIRTPPGARNGRDAGTASQSREHKTPRNLDFSRKAAADITVTRRGSLKEMQKPRPTPYTKQRPLSAVRENSAEKLQQMTAHLTTASLSKNRIPLMDRLSPIKEARGVPSETAGKIPGTPSRKRLVDALVTMEMQRNDVESSNSDDSTASSHESRSATTSPTPPSNSLQTSMSQVQAQMQESDQTPQPPANPRRAPMSTQKVTYARQRSFLTEADLIAGGGGGCGGSNSAESDPFKQMASQSLLGGMDYPVGGQKNEAKKGKKGTPRLSKSTSSLSFEFGADSDDDYGGSGATSSTRGVRSIYELRRAGSNARYQGAIETIFEDLEDEGASLNCKRNSLCQLCANLGNYHFPQRFLSGSLDKRLAKATASLNDPICGFLLVGVYGLLLSTNLMSPVILRTISAEISRLSLVLLSENQDVTETAKNQRDPKMSKAGYRTLKDVAQKLHSSKIWSDPHQKPIVLSPQILALRCMELAIRKTRESGDPFEPLTASVLLQLVELLLQLSLTEKANDDESDDEFLILELVFSILESYTVGLGRLEPEQEDILRSLSRLGPLLSELNQQFGGSSDGASGGTSAARRGKILGLEIRLILNITNNNSRLCEDFATSELVQALAKIILDNFGSVADEESLLDTVILALGALINLTEWSGTARRLILTSRMDEATTQLDGLLTLFGDGLELIAEANSVVQTHSNVVFGYLSVLLCTLATDDKIRSHMRATLAQHGRTLRPLLSTVEEFLHYHRKVEEEIHDIHQHHHQRHRVQETGDDEAVGSTSRLQSIVNRVRDAEMGRG